MGWTLSPQIHVPWETQNVILRIKVFVYIIKIKILKWYHPEIQAGLQFSDWGPYKREANLKFNNHRKKSCEDGGQLWRYPVTKPETPKVALNHQKLDIGQEHLLLRSPRGTNPTESLILAAGLQNCETINFYCSKTLHLWRFFAAASGNKYSKNQWNTYIGWSVSTWVLSILHNI